MNIRTTLQPNGEYTAIDDDTYDGEGSLMGWGATEAEAIEDLISQACEKAVSNALDLSVKALVLVYVGFSR